MLAATLVLLVCASVAGLLLTGVVYRASDVEVVGAQGLTTDEVVAAAAVPLGTPLVRLDLDAVSARVAELPRVASVRVSRGVTGTVTVEVTERVPVAFRSAEDGAHLVDATATDFAVVPVPPPGVPELRVRRVATDDPTAAAAVAVIAGLPAQLRGSVRVVEGESPANVRLTLGDGREVRWGGPEAAERKARVLQALLTQPGRVYDVSSPDLPTVS